MCITFTQWNHAWYEQKATPFRCQPIFAADVRPTSWLKRRYVIISPFANTDYDALRVICHRFLEDKQTYKIYFLPVFAHHLVGKSQSSFMMCNLYSQRMGFQPNTMQKPRKSHLKVCFSSRNQQSYYPQCNVIWVCERAYYLQLSCTGMFTLHWNYLFLKLPWENLTWH